MADSLNSIESLLEKAAEYGQGVYALVKLQIMDKTSVVASTVISQVSFLAIFGFFLFFLSGGAAVWIGEILGKLWYGLFAVAGFYAFIALVFRLFMYRWVKRKICDYIVKQEFK